MFRRFWLAGAVLAAIVGIVTSLVFLQPSAADGQPMLLPTDATPLVAVTGSGERAFSIEIADDDAERAAGLMFREQMDDDHGMLFVFEQTRPVGFWMKNTPMPLDLIFIDQDGRVKAVRRGEPFSEALIAPDDPVRFVLELKAGMAEKASIQEGDLFRHPVIGAVQPGN